ncbi:MAG: type II secretion system minor pseudopilin GspK [Proteobacteria bacterium]|nr:type II secretion system minor pseudopilin GspK [Pseudomonadota bacterium]MBU1456759.1 type II secretion system minor pseudopilin GspK [Pseudomonadota bacterium]
MRQVLDNHRGMALLLVISLVSVLAIVTLQFNREMRQDYVASASLRNSVRLGVIVRSGTTLAELILLKDQEENNFDSLHDSWALLSEEDLSLLFAPETLELAVSDEGGKFQINAMVTRKKQGQVSTSTNDKQQVQHEIDVRNILWRLLRAEPYLVEDGEARGIIDALIDWMDGGDGDGEEEYGAEDNYYRSLDPPYSCKNGPVESIEELLLVKGITRDLLYGTDERPPLAPLLTAWENDGKININTADPLLLQSLNQGMDKEIAEAMISYREDENNRELLASKEWYKNVPSFPGDIELQKDLIKTKSNFFKIEATAGFETQKKKVTATVERQDNAIFLLRWDSN